MGFTLNSYDTCVANKVMNGKICTIIWHVDDLKISDVDLSVVTEIITALSKNMANFKSVRANCTTTVE